MVKPSSNSNSSALAFLARQLIDSLASSALAPLFQSMALSALWLRLLISSKASSASQLFQIFASLASLTRRPR
jgi:hypothetical protein